jgi:hypothetical protein
MKTNRIDKMTYDEALGIAGLEAGSQTGRRIKLQDGRRATVIRSFCCVAGRHSGDVHLDGTPADKLVVANWV